MADVFDTATRTVFASPLARDGTYTPQGEDPVDVRVILERRVESQDVEATVGLQGGDWTALIRIAQLRPKIGRDPKRDDQIQADGRTFTVQSSGRDAKHLMYELKVL